MRRRERRGTVPRARFETVAELLRQLGGISGRRVRLSPAPGTATEDDLLAVNDRHSALCELVDGVLVEKVIGFPESVLTLTLAKILGNFLDQTGLGFLAGPDGGMRLMPGLVRLPDISFVSWDRLPGKVYPSDPVADLAPDLAIEVVS